VRVLPLIGLSYEINFILSGKFYSIVEEKSVKAQSVLILRKSVGTIS